jgi:histone-lysine N-methyltransferase SETD3
MFGANDSSSSSSSRSNNYNPLHKSIEADKFQLFEKWLRDNGAQFPQLELRQYDNNNGNNNNAAKNSNNNNNGMIYDNNDDDDAEEKKDGGGSDMGDVASMLSLDNSNNIEEDDGSNEMRSVHATSTIPPQTICVSIPKSCLITVEMGQSTPIGQAILQSDVELDAPKHIFLMIYLLYDKKINGQNSFFAPYYNILPKSLRNMPIFWNEHELQYLQGSFLLSQIADRSDAIREDYERICSIPHINFESLVSLDEFRWARMIVCSRNFGLLINGHRTSALVPHADMLNHHRPRETKWTYCEETQCFTITTLQSIAMGEQVYDSYGQKCNHRFLLNYGFCVERNIEVDGFCPNEVPLELGLDGFGGVVIFGENLVKEGGGSGGGNDDSKECREKKLAFWTRGDGVASHHHHMFGGGGVGSSFQATLAAAMAAGASSSSTSSSSSRELFNAMMDPGTASSLKEAFGGGEASKHMKPTSPSSAPSSYRNVVRHVKRVRVCVSNNENTRILFSMLRVLASNTVEIDHLSRLGGPSYAPSVAAQRLFGLPPAGTPGGPPSSSTVRTCRDIRYPISLHNERRAMELLLDITGRALSKYPTSLAQDTSDLLDEVAYPKYSNKRNAKLQVRGEKEVLHHFALWARTAMHVIDIILHELSVERKLVSSSRGVGVESGGAGGGNASHNNEELGFEYVIQAMEDDDDCHFTVLRYCSDVLGAVRRDELANIRY